MNSVLDIKPTRTASKKKKRVGRGPGSNFGKTCGRGQKGQRSRSGVSIPAWFEGGQTPIYRRVPKRGFHNKFAQKWNLLTLWKLKSSVEKIVKLVPKDKMIDSQFLREHGIINKKDLPVKLIGISLGSKTKSDKAALTPLKGLNLLIHKSSKSISGLLEKQGINIETVPYRKRLSKMQRNRAEQKTQKNQKAKKSLNS